MASGYGEESVLKPVPQDVNAHLGMVRDLHQHYVSENAKLQGEVHEQVLLNQILRGKLDEIAQYVNSVLNQDGPQPG